MWEIMRTAPIDGAASKGKPQAVSLFYFSLLLFHDTFAGQFLAMLSAFSRDVSMYDPPVKPAGAENSIVKKGMKNVGKNQSDRK